MLQNSNALKSLMVGCPIGEDGSLRILEYCYFHAGNPFALYKDTSQKPGKW